MSSIKFSTHTLQNGLRVLVHRDTSTALASVNLLYRVGARNETVGQTGLAHLCEHLMFGGSVNAPDFDTVLQEVAGENNAFTNNDYTNYYITLPVSAIETALWLEADRMENLALSDKSVSVQKSVVLEEFAQRYTNQPYGDVWHLLRGAVYPQGHHYSWPTIGANPLEIERMTTQTVQGFYERFYSPENCILSVVSPMEEEVVVGLVEKYFGHIKPRKTPESAQNFSGFTFTNHHLCVERDVPASMIYICIPMQGRVSRQATVLDVTTDILSGGESSRMVQNLVKGQALFSSVNCYISAEEGSGMLVCTGRLMPSTTMQQAEDALWREMKNIIHTPPTPHEMQKVRNKYEANNYFTQLNSLNKAMNLGYYEFLGNANLINQSVEIHRSVSVLDIIEECKNILDPKKATTLHYHAKNNKHNEQQ